MIAADSRRTVCYTGLLAHWKLDEGKGDAVADCSGNGHQGTLRNGPQWAAGRQGGALSFGGGGSYVEMDTCFSELAVPLSIAFWVNPAKSQVPYANILGNHGDFWAGLGMEQQGNNTNAFGFGYGDGTKWLGTGPAGFAANKSAAHDRRVRRPVRDSLRQWRREEQEPRQRPAGSQSGSAIQAGTRLQTGCEAVLPWAIAGRAESTAGHSRPLK